LLEDEAFPPVAGRMMEAFLRRDFHWIPESKVADGDDFRSERTYYSKGKGFNVKEALRSYSQL